jgi:hypothetical protein
VIEFDMNDIFLSMPVLCPYLVFLVALLFAALWARETSPPAGEFRGTVQTTGRGVGDAVMATGCDLDFSPLRGPTLQPQHDHGPFRDLQAALSASYAARSEQALRSIRSGAPAGARPTGKVAG